MNITNLRTQVEYFKAEAARLKDPALKALMLQQAQQAQAKINKYEATKSNSFWAKLEAKYAQETQTVEEPIVDASVEENEPKRRGRKPKQETE